MVDSAKIVLLRGSNAHDSWKDAGAMQPTMVATTLSKVESEWRSQALQFAECSAEANAGDCGAVAGSFKKSCGTVVSAIITASSGDRETVREYMAVVCDEPQLRGWKRGRCQNFAQAMLDTLTADSYQNREHPNLARPCAYLWTNMSTIEGARIAQEHQLQEKLIEAEKAKRAKLAQAASAAAAAAAARKRARETAEARRKSAEARLQEAKKRLQVQAARRAAEEKKKAAEHTAVLKAAAELKAAKKAAAEKKARERLEAARQEATVQAAQADAKLKEAAKQTQETRQRVLEAEAAKAVIRGSQPARASLEAHAPAHAKATSPALARASNNSPIASTSPTRILSEQTVSTGNQPKKQKAYALSAVKP